jgi:hypothetical protein
MKKHRKQSEERKAKDMKGNTEEQKYQANKTEDKCVPVDLSQ